MKVGIVIESNGSDGVYAAGVLDAFAKLKVKPEYIGATSTGSLLAVEYIANQKEKRFDYFSSIAQNRSPEEIISGIDIVSFQKSGIDLQVALTNVMTGEVEYFEKDDVISDSVLLKCACMKFSKKNFLPYKNGVYTSGNFTDPIAVKHAFEKGCNRVIVIRSHERDFRMRPYQGSLYRYIVFNKYPKFYSTLRRCGQNFNDSVDYIADLERLSLSDMRIGLHILCPQQPLKVHFLEKNQSKLKYVYEMGLNDGALYAQQYLSYLEQ